MRRAARIKALLLLLLVSVVVAGSMVLYVAANAQWAKVGNGSYRVVHAGNDGKGGYLVSIRSPYEEAAKTTSASRPSNRQREGLISLVPVPTKAPPLSAFTFAPEAVFLDTFSLFQGHSPTKAQWESRVLQLGPEQHVANILTAEGHSHLVPQDPQSLMTLSPDGSKIAAIDRNGSGLWIYDLVTEDIRLVTASRPTGLPGLLLSLTAPVWSMDGKSIYFHSARNSYPSPSLWSVSIDGSAEKVLVDAADFGGVRLIGLTHDNRLLIQGGKGVLIGNADGTNLSTLVADAVGSSLSPQGTKLLYVTVAPDRHETGFAVLNLGNGTKQSLTAPAGYRPEGRGPVWSISGDRIAQYVVNLKKPDDMLLAVTDLTPISPVTSVYSAPQQGTTFNHQHVPSWLSDIYLVVGLIDAGIGNDAALARPSTWLLRLKGEGSRDEY